MPPGAKVLDVGCAQATAAILLAESGYNVIGVDADPNCLQYACKRDEFALCRFVCLDASKGLGLEALLTDFDAIVLGEVLEHVPNPRKLIASCRERLRSGGRLVISTPNGESPHNWRFAKYHQLAMESSGRDASLLELLRRCGFDIDSWAYLNSYAVNPLGVHRFLPLSTTVALNRLFAQFPIIARFTTMTLFVVARLARDVD
jgi:SAM-dependent methyltransferase